MQDITMIRSKVQLAEIPGPTIIDIYVFSLFLNYRDLQSI